ncbi:hypothetical protein L1887_12904 [Cichorium endivia]|nr:hypothetical protein L1887_12904 [Cichorium endivia]
MKSEPPTRLSLFTKTKTKVISPSSTTSGTLNFSPSFLILGFAPLIFYTSVFLDLLYAFKYPKLKTPRIRCQPLIFTLFLDDTQLSQLITQIIISDLLS